jgi:hypothetical protein
VICFQETAAMPNHGTSADLGEQLYALEQLAESFDATPDLVRAIAHGLIELRARIPKFDEKQQKRVARLHRYIRQQNVPLAMAPVSGWQALQG